MGAELVDDLVIRTAKFNLSAPDLLTGKDQDNTRMFVVVTSNRGLCGGFNGSVVRKARQLAKVHKSNIPDKPSYSYASSICDNLVGLFRDNIFDRCVLVYNKFVSAMTQEVRAHKLIPFKPFADEESAGLMDRSVSDNSSEACRQCKY